MTPQEMLDHFRLQADDAAQPYLWGDALLIGYANEAQLEASRRARLFEDATTQAVCEIAVTAGTAIYDVDARVQFIRRVKLASQSRPLPKASVRALDEGAPGWEASDPSEPIGWIPWETHKVRLVPTPVANDTLRLIVVRDPLLPIDLGNPLAVPTPIDPTPAEAPARYHYALVDWVLHRAYLHRERQDQYRPEESKERLAMFEAEFGERRNAVDDIWIKRKHGYDEDEGLY